MIADRTTLSIAKAGELVGVTRRTIYNWIAGGKVEYVRTAGGSVRIFVDTLWRDPHAGVTQPDTPQTSLFTGAVRRRRHPAGGSPARSRTSSAMS